MATAFTTADWESYLSYIASNCRWMLENRPDQRTGKTWRRKSLEYFLNVDVYAKTREGPVMTSDFMTPPHSIEAEQSVLGGLLLDDDTSERTQKVLSILAGIVLLASAPCHFR